jgi:hypothetical protein
MMTNRFVFGFADTYFLKICIQYKYPHSAPELNDFFPSRTEMLRDFGKMFFWTINIIVFGYTVIYFSIDQIMNPAFTNIDETSKIMRILDLFYFTITTFATVGYGDIVPCPSTILRLVVASQMVAVFLIVVALLSAFTATIESSE